MAGKGIAAEGITVELQIPAGTTVVAATGGGYQGVRGNNAVWMIPSLAAKEQQSYTITLSKPAGQGDLKGAIHWSRPTPSPEDVVNIAAAPAG